ncbi:MAG TPA: DNA polymerase/3'-5' exonuclease PolX [Sedimentisphaerales bacterium]|jgi:DNA polymerase (family 10)|nr:DNA polymerase/3'-5' exonuclease PolX [Sedimentisphaerales bacterium]HNU28277.1 DNA polymerase/3'-5' exonuclease PolX [Sedimentisphaerales bacterium]
MDNAAISTIFSQMADVMEILGEDRFRINSYRTVARVLSEMPADVATLLENGELAETPGIGNSSLAKIEEFVKTGSIQAHRELLTRIPPSLLELLEIPGVGPKTVKAFYHELRIRSLDDLRKALDEGLVETLPGFGPRKADAIRKGIEFLAQAAGRIRLDQAMAAAEAVTTYLKQLPGVDTVQTAGSLRRRAETIGDVDILVGSASNEGILQSFTKAPFVERVLGVGETKASVLLRTDAAPVQVDVRVVPPESFGAAAQYFTGSKAHNVRLREIAVRAGLKLNEYGLFRDEERIAGATEEEIYAQLGLDYVEPLLREDRGEVEAARKHALPELVRLQDIRGDFHTHTNATDGAATIEEMAQAAKSLGYEFLCITDHSQSTIIANGQSPERLARQIEQIHRINAKLKGITILAGAEVDILAEGRLDFENELLADLDWVVASVHSALGGTRERVTLRALKAMDNPYVSCIGHPTGRLIGRREAMDLDMAAVIEHAARTGTALEVNCDPMRLDLRDIHCRMAVEAGVKLALGTDAHSPGSLSLMPFGVATAGRGWATKADLLNTLSVAKVKSWIRSKRPR